MLNLDECWKTAYTEYLKEENKKLDSEIDNLFVELTEIHSEVQKGFRLVEDYFELYGEMTLNEKEEGQAPLGHYENNSAEKFDAKQVSDIFQGLIKNSGGMKELDYSPKAVVEVKSISDMKFPNNIFFFIKQMINWIKNVVIYFIEKIKNVVRVLLGDTKTIKELDPRNLELSLNDSRRMETISTSYSIGKGLKLDGRVSARELNEGVEVLQEDDKPRNVLITLDLGKDMEDLKLLVQHFYNLFDNAFGSFNEKLFETDDLELILKIFKETTEDLLAGRPTVETSLTGSSQVQKINAGRVKENLVMTNQSINKLKFAYTQTSAKIKDILKIISSKELLMLSDLGVKHQILTASTFGPMLEVAKSIQIRLKEANKLMSNLEKTKRGYDELIKKLSENQKSFMSLSTIGYTSVYAKQLNELFVSARYMSDIVTLRISGIALYIRELKDVKDLLIQLNRFSKKELRSKK